MVKWKTIPGFGYRFETTIEDIVIAGTVRRDPDPLLGDWKLNCEYGGTRGKSREACINALRELFPLVTKFDGRLEA